jgi:hypothetical protein
MSDLVKYDDSTKTISKAAVTVGVGGLALWGVAGVLPFVTLPMLLVLLVILGGYRVMFK